MAPIDELRASGSLGDPEAARFVRRGHFAYEGGDHGDASLSLERLFADPVRLQRAAAELARRLARHEADLVCGPLIGGAPVGQRVASELGVGFVYAQARPDSASEGKGYEDRARLPCW